MKANVYILIYMNTNLFQSSAVFKILYYKIQRDYENYKSPHLGILKKSNNCLLCSLNQF